MCTVCGCGEGEVTIEGGHHHHHDHGHHHHHDHHHAHDHRHDEAVEVKEGQIHYGKGPAHAHAPGLSQGRMVQIEQDILAKNNQYAAANRHRFSHGHQLVLNLVSSPGSGKTTLLTETLNRLKEQLPLAVIEGDQQTTHDADRIRSTGVNAIQVNTGKGCHLDAHMVGHAVDHLKLPRFAVLFIENVGNLVCPAGFDLGEDAKVAILSVTEGEDKPLKYPDMFAASKLMLINKVDLLPHLNFDVEQAVEYARRVNPEIEVIQVSATTGEGMDEWLDWIKAQRREKLLRAREGYAREIAEIDAALS